MSSTTWHKTRIRTNTDPFNDCADQNLEQLSINNPFPAASDTERDTQSAAAPGGHPPTGALVVRTDQGAAMQVYDGASWRPLMGTPGFGHMGKTNGAQALTGTPALITMDSMQISRGGVTFDTITDSLVAQTTALYRITMRAYFSGTVAGTNTAFVRVNGTGIGPNLKMVPAAGDTSGCISMIYSLSQGDKVSMSCASGPSGQSAYGTTGYDGCYLEIEQLGPEGIW